MFNFERNNKFPSTYLNTFNSRRNQVQSEVKRQLQREAARESANKYMDLDPKHVKLVEMPENITAKDYFIPEGIASDKVHLNTIPFQF